MTRNELITPTGELRPRNQLSVINTAVVLAAQERVEAMRDAAHRLDVLVIGNEFRFESVELMAQFDALTEELLHRRRQERLMAQPAARQEVTHG